MNNINASDMLSYLGSIIGGLVSLIAIIIAIKQFTIEKKPIIIPRNKYFFISTSSMGIRLHEVLNTDNDDNDSFWDPLPITLENITENAAIAFELTVDYKQGRWYKEICNLIGGEPSDKFASAFEQDYFKKQGVFNSTSTKILHMTGDLEYIIKGIYYRLTESGVNRDELASRNNHFIRENYKIAELKLLSKDINDKDTITVFDIEISFTSVPLKRKMYRVGFTFIMKR
ncbi:MAG TPA: hypothetical protein GX707_00095 [Epulopiscium sp.]|nr:hypothetical protein [Candidatus Epulonipiscium sp.]